jgi:hypothetical protein
MEKNFIFIRFRTKDGLCLLSLNEKDWNISVEISSPLADTDAGSKAPTPGNLFKDVNALGTYLTSKGIKFKPSAEGLKLANRKGAVATIDALKADGYVSKKVETHYEVIHKIDKIALTKGQTIVYVTKNDTNDYYVHLPK